MHLAFCTVVAIVDSNGIDFGHPDIDTPICLRTFAASLVVVEQRPVRAVKTRKKMRYVVVIMHA